MDQVNKSFSGYPIGGPAYIDTKRIQSTLYLLISSSACVIGTIGNIVILVTAIVYRPLRHKRNIFVINLALADLTVTSFADPMGILGMVLGSAWFNEQVLLCDMVATVCIVACVTALFSIGGDGFSRFCHICHPATYHKIFTLRNNILISLGFWVVGITMSLPALLGWTDNVYDPKYLECIWNRKYSLSYTIFFSSGVVATPISIIAISYLKIFWHVRRSRIAMSNAGYCPGAISCVVTNLDHKAIQDQRPIPNKSAALSLKLAKSLSIVFLGFVICWTPYAVIVVADFEDRLPEELHLFALLLAHLHSTINCVIYALTNAQFRAGYRFLMGKIFPCICQSIRIHASAVGTQAMASQQ